MLLSLHMGPILLTLLAVCIVFSCSQIAFAATSVSGETAGRVLFVDAANDKANDYLNPGTEEAPWKTLQYAILNLRAGDTLYVKAGTYKQGGLTLAGLAGRENAWINIQAFPGDKVVLTGAGVHTGRISFSDSKYVLFRGFEITNFNQGVFVEGRSSYITLEALHVFGIGQEAMHVKGNSSYIVVQDNVIHDAGLWEYNGKRNGEGIYVGTGSAGPFDNTNNVTVRNNLVYNTTDEAIELKPGTHDCIVEGNTVYNNNSIVDWGPWGAIQVGRHEVGAQHWGSHPQHIIRNNVIHSTHSDAFGHAAIGLETGALVYNNVIYDVAEDGFGIYVSNPAKDSFVRKIYHNTVYAPSSRAIVVAAGEADIRNNIGPATDGNIETSDEYFASVKAGEEDFRLVGGSAPINAGVDVGIQLDKDGTNRPQGQSFDLGAYEYNK